MTTALLTMHIEAAGASSASQEPGLEPEMTCCGELAPSAFPLEAPGGWVMTFHLALDAEDFGSAGTPASATFYLGGQQAEHTAACETVART